MAAAFALSRLAVRLIAGLRNRMTSGAAALYILERFTGYGIAILGVLFALSSIGINLSSLTIFAGAVGVGVGLGLQGVVKEFVSGLVLLFDNILNVGDFVELPVTGGGSGNAAVRGTVYEIGARATHIRTADNFDIFVPNSRLIEERFINWTLRGQTRRVHIPFSVAYGVDKARVREVVLEAAQNVDFTLPETANHRTQVWLVGFGDSALNFELVVWPKLEAVKRPSAMQAAYTWAIDDALRAEGIEIPFPQQDVRIRSVLGREGDEAYRALGLKVVRPKADGEDVELPSHNDAEQDVRRPQEPPPPPPEKRE
jgi:small-conductance mechanosensitive channel